jgi:ERCC4-type nuclease
MAGFEDECVVERKDLPDLVRSLTTDRAAFVSRLKRMAACRHRLLVITAALSQVKSKYSFSPLT